MMFRSQKKLLHILIGCMITVVTVCQNPGYMPQKSHYLILSDSRKTGVEGNSLQVSCTAHVSSPFSSLKWISHHDGSSAIHQVNENNTTVVMTIFHLHGSDAGRYACVLLMADGREETAEFELYVKPKGANTAACSITQFKCKTSQQCIFLRYRCDGKNDCEDGSDEDCANNPCANKFRCNNTRCVDLQDVCNHVDNCGDFSDEGHFCTDTPSTTTQPTSADNQFGWLKITVIASTVGLVILISFIVIMVYRVKMKRLREQRIARALERMYQPGGSGEPTSSGQGEEGLGDQHPFLPSTSQRHYGNIIVNVNNGVQYMPGYEYSLFMDAPPPYSEVGKSESGDSNAPPPPYSTIDRSTSQQRRRGEGMAGEVADPRSAGTGHPGQQQNISQFSVQNCLGGSRGADRAVNLVYGPEGRGGHPENAGAVGGNIGDGDAVAANENSGVSTGTLSGISINSRFLQSLLGSHSQGATGDTIPRGPREGDGSSSELSDGGLSQRSASTENSLSSALSAGIGSGHGPIVNITHLGTSPHRSRHGPPPVVASHGTQTPRHRAHGTNQSNGVRSIEDTGQEQSPSDVNTDLVNNPNLPPTDRNLLHNSSPRRGDLIGENTNTNDSHIDASGEAAEESLCNPVASRTGDGDTENTADLNAAAEVESGFIDISQPRRHSDDVMHDHIDEILDNAVFDGQIYCEDDGEESSSPLLGASRNIVDLPTEDSTCLIRKHKDRQKSGGSDANSSCISDANNTYDSEDLEVLMPLSPAKTHNPDLASHALFNEVSNRDERNKPKPGHLSVQKGQIVLHTNDGILANDSAVLSEHPHIIGGELAVKDGNIILQAPRSLERNRGHRPSSNSDHRSSGHINEASVNNRGSDPVTVPMSPSTNGSGASSVNTQSPLQSSKFSSSPNTSGSLFNENSIATASTTSAADGNKDGEGTARLSGELNIKDGCLVLEPPKHTPSSQILSHLQGAYAAEQKEEAGDGADCKDEEVLEPVVNTKRPSGVVTRPALPKFNTDIVLPFKNQP